MLEPGQLLGRQVVVVHAHHLNHSDDVIGCGSTGVLQRVEQAGDAIAQIALVSQPVIDRVEMLTDQLHQVGFGLEPLPDFVQAKPQLSQREHPVEAPNIALRVATVTSWGTG